MDRRKFFKKTALSAAGISLIPKGSLLASNSDGTEYFGVHSFVDENPEAVFIMRTDVDVKTNSTAIFNTAKSFADSVLVPKEEGDSGAVPVSNLVSIKPNLTLRQSNKDEYTVEGTMGIVTDVNFVEAFVDTLTGFGVDNTKIHLVETNFDYSDLNDGGYIDMVLRKEITLKNLSDGVGGIEESDIVWKNVVGGSYFKKIPYIYPVNAPNSWLLNIAKLKAHGMGITGCAKNLQGTIVKNYQEHCRRITSGNPNDVPDEDLVINREEIINANYNRHKDAIPRWDKPDRNGGLWQETWGTRCLDNNSVINAGLHIVEGIYGRDGNFVYGPSLGDNNKKGLATDYMSNVIIFGKNPFHVDIIAHWIAGHEPGNFGLFQMAIERGMADILNPMDIPVYEWKSDGTATLTDLTEFPRTPLKTYYLQRDYDEQTEDYWHLCNESYEYPTKIEEKEQKNIPANFELKQNYPNPFNPTTTISYSLKKAGHVNLTLYNVKGQKIATLINRRIEAGVHQYLLDADSVILDLSSGTYFYTLKTSGYMKTKKMVVVK